MFLDHVFTQLDTCETDAVQRRSDISSDDVFLSRSLNQWPTSETTLQLCQVATGESPSRSRHGFVSLIRRPFMPHRISESWCGRSCHDSPFLSSVEDRHPAAHAGHGFPAAFQEHTETTRCNRVCCSPGVLLTGRDNKEACAERGVGGKTPVHAPTALRVRGPCNRGAALSLEALRQGLVARSCYGQCAS